MSNFFPFGGAYHLFSGVQWSSQVKDLLIKPHMFQTASSCLPAKRLWRPLLKAVLQAQAAEEHLLASRRLGGLAQMGLSVFEATRFCWFQRKTKGKPPVFWGPPKKRHAPIATRNCRSPIGFPCPIVCRNDMYLIISQAVLVFLPVWGGLPPCCRYILSYHQFSPR